MPKKQNQKGKVIPLRRGIAKFRSEERKVLEESLLAAKAAKDWKLVREIEEELDGLLDD